MDPINIHMCNRILQFTTLARRPKRFCSIGRIVCFKRFSESKAKLYSEKGERVHYVDSDKF